MNKAQILQELRKIKDVAFATVDSEERPQVRIIDVMLADEETIYFCTARGKAFYHQLCEGGYVAVSGLNKQFQMFRISGRAQKLGDQRRWIDEIFARNPSMNDVYPRDSRYILEPFCIRIEQMEWRKPDLPRRDQPLDRKGLCDRTKLHRMRKVHAKLSAAMHLRWQPLSDRTGALPALWSMCGNLSGPRHPSRR